MSQLEVDKIIPQSGTTLTIGDSGDTINFADGQNISIDTNTLYIDSTNNRVGIGTTSPSTKLHVYSGNSGVTPNGNADDLFIENNGAAGITIGSSVNEKGNIFFADSGNALDGYIQYAHDNRYLRFATATLERMRIDSSGNVGIGTSSPESPLHVVGTNTLLSPLRIQPASGNGASAFSIRQDATADRFNIGLAYSSASGIIGNRVKPSNTSESDATGFLSSSASNVARTAIKFHTSGDIQFYNAPQQNTAVDSVVAMTERMRIDSSGNVLVGTTNSTPGVGNTDTGISLRNNNGGSLAVSRSGDRAAYFNRNTSDGDIVQFRKDGTTVGTIFSRSGVVSGIILDPRAGGNGLLGQTGAIIPVDESQTREDNATDLGNSSYRYKDLYLGGGLYVGGTGTANKLDDYEEGTWTPSIQASGTHYSSITHTVQNGRYTKIGRQVFAHFRVTISAVTIGSASGNINVEGLPFTCSSADSTNQAGYVSYVSDVNFNLSSFGTINIGLNAYQNQNKGGLTRSRNSGSADGLHNSSIGQATDIVGTFIFFVD